MTAQQLAEQVGRLLLSRRLTLGLAESCTGGLVSDLITNVPGSSAYFLGGIVSYAYSAKEAVLGVRHETLLAHGAVSRETAAEMAWGARRVLRADIALSVTGIAGPTGGTADKPVGLVYAHLSADDAEIGERYLWHGDRVANKAASAEAVLRLLLGYLESRQGDTAQPELAGNVEFIDRPVVVEPRAGDTLQPAAVTWDGQRHAIASTGRQWDENTGQHRWHFCLAQTAGLDTLELRLDLASGEWRLMRAWWGRRLA